MKPVDELFAEADRNLIEFRDKVQDLADCIGRVLANLEHEKKVHSKCHDKIEERNK